MKFLLDDYNGTCQPFVKKIKSVVSRALRNPCFVNFEKLTITGMTFFQCQNICTCLAAATTTAAASATTTQPAVFWRTKAHDGQEFGAGTDEKSS